MAITELYGSNDRNAVPDVASGYTPVRHHFRRCAGNIRAQLCRLPREPSLLTRRL